MRVHCYRMAGLEQKFEEQREAEDLKASMSIKCLSCGTLHKDHTLGAGAAGGGRTSPEQSRLLEMVKSVPHTREDYEQMMAVLQRSAGLRGLDRQYMPIDVGSPDTQSVGSSVSKGGGSVYVIDVSGGSVVKEGERVALEPLYRKARLAAHMKELVKIPHSSVKLSNTADAYPEKRYVLDTPAPAYSNTNPSLNPGGNILTSPSTGSLPQINRGGSTFGAVGGVGKGNNIGNGYNNYQSGGGFGGGAGMLDSVSVSSDITTNSHASISSSSNKYRKFIK